MARCWAICAPGSTTRSTLSSRTTAVCDVLANRAAAELRLVHVKRERAVLRAQKRQLRAEIAALHDVKAIVGARVPRYHRVVEDVRRFAADPRHVLVSGEPGTGKELVARAIHAASPRAPRLSPGSTARTEHRCRSRQLAQIAGFASGGTLFLDEIGALSSDMQARLSMPCGRSPASGANPARRHPAARRHQSRSCPAVREGEFREDLYRRIAVFTLEIPPLRARIEDIPPLVQLFVQKLARRLGRQIERVDSDTMAGLMRYSWPGNMRELENLVERALVTQHAPVLKITAELIVGSPAERAALIAAAGDPDNHVDHARRRVDFDDTLNTGLHVVQREHILRVLNATHWVIEGKSRRRAEARPQAGDAAPSHEEARHLARAEPAVAAEENHP